MTAAERDFGQEAQRAAEHRLELLRRWQYHHEDPEGCAAPEEPEPDTDAPYCGCETCDVRETLAAAWPLLLELAELRVRAEP